MLTLLYLRLIYIPILAVLYLMAENTDKKLRNDKSQRSYRVARLTLLQYNNHYNSKLEEYKSQRQW